MTRIVRTTKRRRTPLLLMALVGMALGVLIAGGSLGSAAPSTDASVVDYSQCANGKPGATPANNPATCNQGWINGILQGSNSQYAEDQMTAQRLVIELPKGGPVGDGTTTGDRTITLKYLWNKASHHAYDSLARWNLNPITGVTTAADACAGVPGGASGCPATAGNWNGGLGTSTALGAAQVPSSPCSAGHEISDRTIAMFGGTIDSISTPVNDSPSPTCSLTADEYETVTIYYHVSSLASNTRVMILFGGHLAAGGGPRSWGSGNGASDINGGPYHIKLIQLDSSSIGNRDNQISAGAILPLTTSVTTNLHQTDSSGTDVNPANNQTGSATGITVLPGSYVTDYATVLPLGATGTVSFRYYASSSACTADTTFTAGTPAGTNKALDANGVAKSDTVLFSSETTVYWRAFFDGTDISNDALSSCTGEVLTVSKASPGLTSAPRLIPQDKATLSSIASGGTPQATITFKLFPPSNSTCDPAGTAAVYTESQNVTGNGDYITSNSGDPSGTPAGFRITSASATGTYRWLVTYSGDSKNNSNSAACGVESFTVTGVTDKTS